MATISSPGIGSGLDVKSIVAQLVAIEKRAADQAAGAGGHGADPRFRCSDRSSRWFPPCRMQPAG